MERNDRGTGQPDGADDMINKYGTYEVQRTCGTENNYPQIAQGIAKTAAEPLKKKKDVWLENDIVSDDL